MRKPVDIIVPIYNAYDDLQLCVDSIKKHTNLSLDRLILINDVSTDERMVGYLRGLQEDNIIFIDNETNQGFSNNVNQGMLYSDDRDVILLNSDTIVTENWVEKIVECAYSAEEIGTVTPLSNSATLCSVPVMCQDNKIPDNVTIDQMAEIVENCSVKAYPRITVAVGFCMFIKRETIKAVGLFDAETFERGYGEENDFCNRAEQLGYIHVMCDDTFIYHKGTVSFMSEQKQKLIEAHDKILNERYPVQMKNNHLYCLNNPEQYIRDNINVHLNIANGKSNVLFLSHLDFRKDAKENMGGTQFHVRDLTFNLLDKSNIFVMARDDEYIRLTVYTDKSEDSFKFYVGKQSDFFRFRDRRFKDIFANVLDAFKIDKVHIHHVYGLSFDLFYEAKNRNIPLFLTLHDYFFVCPVVKLMDKDNHYCNGDVNSSVCQKCMNSKMGVANAEEYIYRWRGECKKVLDMTDKIITPSEDAKAVVCNVYKDIENKICVIEHGTEIENKEIEKDISAVEIEQSDDVKSYVDKVEYIGGEIANIIGWAIIRGTDNEKVKVYIEANYNGELKYYQVNKFPRIDLAEYYDSDEYIKSGIIFKLCKEKLNEFKFHFVFEDKGRFFRDKVEYEIRYEETKKTVEKHKVAFIGGMVPEKGSELAYKMIIGTPKEKYEWYLFGEIGDEKLLKLEQDNYTRIGRYEVSDLPYYMKSLGIELVCILPIWPETFCYTLSEAVLCNVPVLGTDIGAVGSRIRRHGYGWTVNATASADVVVEKIDNIFKDKDDYEKKKASAKDFKEITLNEMADKYYQLYNSVTAKPEYRNWSRSFLLKNLYVQNRLSFHKIYPEEKKLEEALTRKDELAAEKRRLSYELETIKNSRSYKITRKIVGLVRRKHEREKYTV